MNWMYWCIFGYILLFAGAATGLAIWIAKRRKEKPPVEFKLLRAPGESLRRRLAKADEQDQLYMLTAAFIPLAALIICGYSLQMGAPQSWLQFGIWAGGASLCFIGSLVLSLCWMVKRLQRYWNDALGYLGEREVAEHMLPLIAQGYHVFHDVPAEGKKKKFNLDHVAVGPSGVAVIETKTRRKGRARPGRASHQVFYNGQNLDWPWGIVNHGLNQAINEAEWLQTFIKEELKLEITVRPILALPGWWVESQGRGTVWVTNSKNVSTAVAYGGRALNDAQIKQIATKLDTLCRDVED